MISAIGASSGWSTVSRAYRWYACGDIVPDYREATVSREVNTGRGACVGWFM